MDVEIFEAARQYVAVARMLDKAADEVTRLRRLGLDRRNDLINLLHALSDIEKPICLSFDDGTTLVCQYDCEEGFVSFSEYETFPEWDSTGIRTNIDSSFPEASNGE